MERKAVSAIMLTLFLTGMLMLPLDVRLVKASGTIYIRADGSVDPPSAAIVTVDNFTYYFTDNIYDEIVIERDNMIMDGNGYTLQGTGTEYGFFLYQRNNITIKNTNIEVFRYGIYLESCSNTRITDNVITKCDNHGIYIYPTCMNNEISQNTIVNNGNCVEIRGSFNSLTGNNITSSASCGVDIGGSLNIVEQNIIRDHWYGIFVGGTSHSISFNEIANNAHGIWVEHGGKNTISSNNITDNNEYGIYHDGSDYNTITLNNIEKNKDGVCLTGSYMGEAYSNLLTLNNIANNRRYGLKIGTYSRYDVVHHNNFINNEVTSSYTTFLDDDYPSGGNYWSDYNGTDLYSGPNQDEPGSDGIGDTPHEVSGGVDNYPLMYPVIIPPSQPLPIASFTYSPSHPYNPVVGQAITFDASQSKRAIRYTWDFADGKTASTTYPHITHSYSTDGTYNVKLTVTDMYGRTDTSNKTVTVKKPLVVLVHGSQLGREDPGEVWQVMKQRLEGDGFTTRVSYYVDSEYDYENPMYPTNPYYRKWLTTTEDITKYSGNLAKEIAYWKNREKVDQVDIVAHSMGGLVARWYIENGGGSKNVRNLIMLGTPNHGSELASSVQLLSFVIKYFLANGKYADFIKEVGKITEELLGESWKQIALFSSFLNTLNYEKPVVMPWELMGDDRLRDQLSPLVHYVTIAGTQDNPGTGWILLDDDDGLVAVWSVLLDAEGVESYLDVGLGTLVNHTALREDPAIYQKIKEVLEAPAVKEQSASANGYPEMQVQMAPIILDKILPGQQKMHEMTMSSTSEFNTVLSWVEGELNLTLTTPNGTVIDPLYASNNMNITFHSDKDLALKGYNVGNPESGTWQLNVIAANITGEQDYIITTFLDTNTTLYLELEKYQYDSGEPIIVRANLTYSGEPVTNASLVAEIQKPDKTTETIMLYDDGLHNDNQTDDGIYGNTFTNTSLGGTYDVTVMATGIVYSDQFARETYAKVWVEQYPDLTINESDITFSDENPVAGEKITINATIHNVGEAPAHNASILFYDGNPENGTLIGEDAIDVTTGGAETASIQWTATIGTHEISVLINPYNTFLEENYTNNMAYAPIRVISALSIYTDKYSYSSGDTMNLGLNITNPYGATSMCVAIWIETPDNSTKVIIHVHNATFPADFTYSNPSFNMYTLPNITPGTYAWHAALLDPSTHAIIVMDTAEWQFT